MNILPCNPNAAIEVRKVLAYLSKLQGEGILTGQHTKTRAQEELTYLKDVTGRQPALCGFELLSYSPNIRYETCNEECLKEIEENKDSLEQAYAWAEKKGFITFTWHWFSPIGGSDKSFYAKNTDYDASKAILEGTEEYQALLSDMDHMAEILKTFRDRKIPILWRPFHEADGSWFWWGRSGPEVAKKLYLIMFDRYTKQHELNNLIWVWNSSDREGYVGDQYCDIISRDIYPQAHHHTDQAEAYKELIRISPEGKMAAITEIGTIPSIHKLSESRIPWLWFMTWCEEILSERYTYKYELYQAYNHNYAITLDKLPELY